jgi:hypothetical protein
MVALVATLAIAVGACGSDGPTAPTTGGIQITVVASGPDVDADGFTITVDGSDTKTVAAGATVNFTQLSPGSHIVQIGDVADNCQTDGSDTQTLTVTAGQNVSGAFSVGCDAIVSGSWSYSTDLALAGVPCTLTEDLAITQTASSFSGVASNGWMMCPLGGIDEAAPGAAIVNGVSQAFSVVFDFDNSNIHHTGSVAANVMNGSVTFTLDSGTIVGTWSATRTGGLQLIAPRARGADVTASLDEIARRLRQ